MDGDEDQYDNMGWGFLEELGFKVFNEEIFKDVEEDGIQTIIKSDNPNFKKFVELALSKGDVFFDEDENNIDKDQWKNKVEGSTSCIITICDCSPDM